MSQEDTGRPAGRPYARLRGEEQNILLEMVATGASIDKILTTLCASIEQEAEGLFATVLLTDVQGHVLHHVYGPLVTDEVRKQIGIIEVGDECSIVAIAAKQRDVIIVEDVQADSRVERHRDLLTRYGVASIWAAPIFGRSNKLLGSFALTYTEPRTPTDAELALIRKAALIAAIAIEDHRGLQQGQDAELDKLSLMTELDRQQQLARLHGAAQKLALAWPEGEGNVEDKFVNLFAQALFATCGALWQQDPHAPRGWLHVVGTYNLTNEELDLTQFTRVQIEPGSLADRAYQAGDSKLVWEYDESKLSAHERQLWATCDASTLYCCALRLSDTTYGLLYAASPAQHLPSPVQVTSAENVARAVAGGYERRTLQQQLNDREETMREFVEHSLDLIVTTREGRFVSVNQASRRLLGYEPEEMTGQEVVHFVHPEDVQATVDRRAQVRAGEPLLHFRNRFVHKDGRAVWLDWTARARDDSGVIFAIGRDITAQQQEEARAKSLLRINQRLASTLDTRELLDALVEEACALVDAQGGCAGLQTDDGMTCWRYLKDGQPHELEYTWPEGHGLPGWLLLHHQPYLTNDTANDPQIVQELCEVFGVRNALSVPIMTHAGRLLGFFELHNKRGNQPFTPQDTELLQGVAHAAAIGLQNAVSFGEMQRVQRELERSRRWYQALAEYESGFVFVLDAEGRILHISNSVTRHLGYSPDELVETSSFDLVHPEDLPITLETFGRLVNDAGTEHTVTLRTRRKDGSYLWLEAVGRNRLNDPDVGCIVVNSRDVTALRTANLALETRYGRLDALHQIDLAIMSSLDLRVTLGVVLEQTVQQLAVDAANVLLLTPGTHELKPGASRGLRSFALTRRSVRLGEGLAGRIAVEQKGRRAHLIRDRHLLARKELVDHEGLVGYHGVPLVAKGRVLGVLEVFGRTELPEESDWVEFLEMLAGQTAIAVDSAGMFRDLQRGNLELTLAYERTIEGWARALDLRDKETEGHSQRVTDLTIELAQRLGFNDEQLVHVRRGALLHDIGKMGVPDGILLKPGRLTDEEWTVMKRHPEFAYELLSPIDFLRPALDIPYAHHEKWDGSGYPRGLRGEEIPLAARVFAVVDVWDALRSDRPYRAGWPVERVIEHIREGAGTHFDPRVVEVFLELMRTGSVR